MVKRIERIIASIFFCVWELFKHPGMFFKRHFFWKAYRSKFYPIKGVKVYDIDKERVFAQFLLKNWFLKPATNSLENNIESITRIKTALYNAIKNKKIENDVYELIESGIKMGGSHAWELNIDILAKMSRSLIGFRYIVVKMLGSSDGKVRETSLIIIEDGGFTINEKVKYYSASLQDKAKRVRCRAMDMISREGDKLFVKLDEQSKLLYKCEKDILEKEIKNFYKKSY